MKVSYNWLREYINLNLKPHDLAERLTMAGVEVKSVDDNDGDFIFEVEITSNRPDWLSVYGIAREIRAITGSKLKPIKAASIKSAKLPKPSIKIEDKKGCPRYVGRLIEGLQVGASPKWLIDRLESVGIRGVNNVVDVTNFCLMESGQPLHAFDFDRLEGGKIIVRRARKGEEIITIDGVKRKLDENTLVIADARKPVAIAGIMGGKDTEVTYATKRILLESAYFDPPLIRKASRALGISTDSSYRFERRIDFNNVPSASERAAGLICGMADCKAVSKAADEGVKGVNETKINLKISTANKILGADIPAAKCSAILKGLGLRVKQKSKDTFEVFAPTFRGDLKTEIDLIEELARIYGYEKIPETLADIPLWGQGGQKQKDKIVEEITRETLAGMGLNEVITYALRCKDDYVTNAMDIGDEKILKVQNPLSSESEALRPVLLCGMTDVISYNLNRKISDIKIFELGKSYFCSDNGAPYEKEILAIAICGMKVKDWHSKEAVDVFDLKGMIEALFEKLGISEYEIETGRFPLYSPAAAASIKIGGKLAGILGKVDKQFLDRYDIKCPVFASELDLRLICEQAKLEHNFSELPKYPSAIRDISLIVDEGISNKDIVTLIKETCGKLAVCVKPFDLYRGEQVPKGSKSILYSVEYRASDRTLTDEEVNNLDRKVREVLVRRFNAKIR